SATASQGTCAGTATVTCSLGTLAAGTRSATATSGESVPANTTTSTRTFTNTASITGTPNDDTSKDSSTAATTQAGVTRSAAEQIGKTAPATVAQAGGEISYAITASHTGNAAATGVMVSDTLPAGTTFVSATASQGTCAGTATVTCSLGTLAAGT